MTSGSVQPSLPPIGVPRKRSSEELEEGETPGSDVPDAGGVPRGPRNGPWRGGRGGRGKGGGFNRRQPHRNIPTRNLVIPRRAWPVKRR